MAVLQHGENAALAAELRDIALATQYMEQERVSASFAAAADAVGVYPRALSLNHLPGRDGISSVPGIGGRIRDCIAAWLERGDANPNSRVATERVSPEFAAYKLFLSILGVGHVTALRWVEGGRYTIADLAGYKLSRVQELGVLYYTDLATRIPRAEIEEWRGAARDEYTGMGGTFEILGSYRRGAAESGDIDVLVSGETSHLIPFMKWCESRPGFVATLGAGPARASFLARLLPDGWVRQIDLLYSVPAEAALARLYFTGSANFNIAMRRVAKESSLLLNQRALGPVNGPPLICESEGDVFRHLGLEFVAPEQRIGFENLKRVA